MSAAVIKDFIANPWGANVSTASFQPTRTFYWSNLDYIDNPLFDTDKFAKNFYTHKQMINQSVGNSDDSTLMFYLSMPQGYMSQPDNSADSAKSLSASYYKKIEERLADLPSTDSNEDDGIEQGAVDSALALVKNLQASDFSPPAISWHGGDAVVMLWSLGSTTYAITVTDGELGYVVRQDKKEIKSADSIKLGAFRLEDLR